MRLLTAASSHAEGLSAVSTNEIYLTDRELAPQLKWSTKTLETKVRKGVFREGIHYFQRPGMRRRWKWSAVVRWLENGDDAHWDETSIPLAGTTRGRAGR
jgi:hypothetical protein